MNEEDEEPMNAKEKKELTLSKIVLITLIVVALALVIWFGWVRSSDPTQDSAEGIDNYAACIEGGNPVQESYPEVCVTEDGRRFPNPAQ